MDDPRSEPRLLHELTLKKMAEDAEIACVQKSPLPQEKSGEDTSVNRRP